MHGKGYPYREKKKARKQTRDWCSHDTSFEGSRVKHGVGYSKYQRVRVRCPVCKRRMIARVMVCSIGCCVTFHIPRHKTR